MFEWCTYSMKIKVHLMELNRFYATSSLSPPGHNSACKTQHNTHHNYITGSCRRHDITMFSDHFEILTQHPPCNPPNWLTFPFFVWNVFWWGISFSKTIRAQWPLALSGLRITIDNWNPWLGTTLTDTSWCQIFMKMYSYLLCWVIKISQMSTLGC